MAALELLLSHARRHCTTRARASLLGFHRSLCSSSSSSSNPDPPQPDEPLKRSTESVPIQSVSYAMKPKDLSPPSPENPQPQTPSPQPPLPRRPRQPGSDWGSAESRSMWTREDMRYVKDAPSISPVSYPTRVAPLPEDRVTAEAEEEVGKKESEEMEKERIRIEAENRIRRRVFRVEEEKAFPFPRLIKVEKKQEQKVILDLMDAIREVKANANRNFDETIEAHVRLGIDRRRSDMTVRGAATLPHGSGKVVRVAVFAEGTAAEEARAAGADIVGGDDLIDEIKNLHQGGGKLNFDRCIATPQMMPRLTKISRILRSLMPNTNRGSVTVDIAKAVGEAKRGRVEFKMDKTAIVHVGLGKVSFSEKVLRENIGAFVNALLLAKPAGLKKTSKYAGYVNAFHLCSTMGPGFPVSIQSLSMAADHYNKLHAQ